MSWSSEYKKSREICIFFLFSCLILSPSRCAAEVIKCIQVIYLIRRSILSQLSAVPRDETSSPREASECQEDEALPGIQVQQREQL